MNKPDAITQAMWDKMNPKQREFVVAQERMHERILQAFKFGFSPNQVLEGTSADAAAYRRNSWMF